MAGVAINEDESKLVVDVPPMRNIRITRQYEAGGGLRAGRMAFVIRDKKELDELIEVLQKLRKDWKD